MCCSFNDRSPWLRGYAIQHTTGPGSTYVYVAVYGATVPYGTGRTNERTTTRSARPAGKQPIRNEHPHIVKVTNQWPESRLYVPPQFSNSGSVWTQLLYYMLLRRDSTFFFLNVLLFLHPPSVFYFIFFFITVILWLLSFLLGLCASGSTTTFPSGFFDQNKIVCWLYTR